MGRVPRADIGGEIFHVINRANARLNIFHSDQDYRHFETLLCLAKEKVDIRILAYVLMPNHWHLVLHPKKDGDVQKFMQWLTLTHTQQRHAKEGTIGYGHLYQGRYKSFPVEKDQYLIQLVRYVERNPIRAKLVRKAENWRWGSAYRRILGTVEERKLLSPLPTELPKNFNTWINQPEDDETLEDIRNSIIKGKPYGTMGWTERMVRRFGLNLTLRKRGRPKKGT